MTTVAVSGCSPAPTPCTGAGCGTDGGAMLDTGPSGTDVGPGTDTGPSGTDVGPGTDTGGATVPGGTVRVTITRSAGLTFGSGDGSGVLFIDTGSDCPYTGAIAVELTTMHGVVDMTSPTFSMTYDITGVTPGTHHVWAWIDDNADGMPFPQGGDAGNFPTCAMATVSATAGAAVTLTFESSTWN